MKKLEWSAPQVRRVGVKTATKGNFPVAAFDSACFGIPFGGGASSECP